MAVQPVTQGSPFNLSGPAAGSDRSSRK